MNHSTLVSETKELCKKENQINSQIIKNLIVISERKIHLEMGFGSLFDFCTQELGLSPASAQRKLDAVRIAEAVPDLPIRIANGALTQSKISQVSKFLREEKKHLDRTFSKTQVREIVLEVQNTRNDFEAQKLLSFKSEMIVKPIEEKFKFVPGGRQTLQIEVDEEFLDLLKQVKDLVSHEGFQSNSQLIKKTLQFFLSKKHPGKEIARRFVSHESENPRFVSAHAKRSVWQKNQGKCAFTDPITKRRCGSRFRLQIEHIKPLALGGRSTVDNLTLFCQSHNLFAAEKLGLLKKQRQQAGRIT